MGQIYNKPEVKMPSMGRAGRGGGPGRFGPKEKPKNVKGTLIRIVNIYMRWGKNNCFSYVFNCYFLFYSY